MKISTKVRYGLRIMMDIAQNGGEMPRPIADIAKAQNISEKYVSRLIIELRQAGMILSVRGAGGGYRLRRLPKHITLLEIIEAMEGEISVVECVACPKGCKKSGNCAAREVWLKLNTQIKKTLESITLQDVLNSENDINDYCI